MMLASRSANFLGQTQSRNTTYLIQGVAQLLPRRVQLLLKRVGAQHKRVPFLQPQAIIVKKRRLSPACLLQFKRVEIYLQVCL